MVADVHLLCFYCIIKFLSKLHLVFVVDFCSHTFCPIFVNDTYNLFWKELGAIVTFLSHFGF